MSPRPPVTSSRIISDPGPAVSPLILQAQIVAPAGGGAMGLADTTRLENPFQAPMWIDEIRFRIPGGNTVEWSSISIELKLGNLSLTRSNVPIGLFGKVLTDQNFDSDSGTQYEYTWKLPKPLFIPARELLRPTVYFQAYAGATSRTVTILYVCRPLPRDYPTPKNLQVPWVSYFQPPNLTLPSASADRSDASTPSDLYNPWDQDLHVQRFIGRLLPRNVASEMQNLMSLDSAKVDLTTGLVTTGTLVSAQDSMNNILIRDPTPFGHVFDFIDRSWTVNCILPPKGFYLFTVDRLWSNYAAALTASVCIGMVGWREVRFYP